MPELPEVESVRRGLAAVVPGRRIDRVQVLHPRPVRSFLGTPEEFAAALTGRTFSQPQRRGKFLWLPFVDGDAMTAHLGMSGQFRLDRPDAPLLPNTRVLIDLAPDAGQLRFIDQRMFGGLGLSAGGAELPRELAHIALDPFDPLFDPDAVARCLITRRTKLKSALLDQRLISGIGNIYADEALWRSRVHGDRRADDLSLRTARRVLGHATAVMAEAVEQGGTSFDALYVNVNGNSGYFGRHLDAYGREGQPCARCGRLIVRSHFENRSSYFCPRCQRRRR